MWKASFLARAGLASGKLRSFEMALTLAQKEAIAARGNVLVVAGAGTGKTRTLVERCLDCLISERPRASLEEILLVTFTEAAAAEMRQRIRARIEDELARNPGEAHWQEQLALFETAHLGTIHSFCFELVRSHFYELKLDPQVSILPEEETRLLAEETLDQVLQTHYAGKSPTAEAVQQLIQSQARGSDQPVRGLVLRLHNYSQSLPNPAEWLRHQLAIFSSPLPALWRDWLVDAVADWRRRGLAFLAKNRAANQVAEDCAQALSALDPRPTIEQAAQALADVLSAEANCPRGKKKHWVLPLEDFFEDSRFLSTLMPAQNQPDPLQQDWDWVRGQMSTLLGLVVEFGSSFGEAKRELGVLDFHDLEQYALQLLWDNKADRPTPIAREWRQQLRFVFVDEYQDINAAQDRIIRALSRDGAEANCFLVGDVKQSIYRFRLANPRIFQSYVENWRNGPARVIPLQDNFRSRKGILDFVNSVAGHLMHRELGGIDYDEQARLRFGERDVPCVPPPVQDPVVELQLRIKSNGDDEENGSENGDMPGEFADLEEAAKEARTVALRLRELVTASYPVWDEEAGRSRRLEWRDISILLRAPSNKAESYAKEFARLNIPLQVARRGFYEALEIGDLLSLLQVLDNPLQDLPLLALLRSPLVALTLDELAEIRLAARHTSYWTALVRWREKHDFESPKSKPQSPKSEDTTRTTGHETLLAEKVSSFLEKFARWRRLARQVALSRCLETILAETQYADWLAAQPRGDQRCANIKRLLLLAQRFDQLQRQGLFRFLRFIEAQRRAETEPELTTVSSENAVRLMSIHQSKGLEFPVVVLADLGKPFNESDLRAEIILDEQYGLCPKVKPPHAGKRYPSLPHWLAARRQKRELLGEELRLLYVAMTRAKELLILSGRVSQQSYDRMWLADAAAQEPPLESARSFADWLGSWFNRNVAAAPPVAGQNEFLRWVIQTDAVLTSDAAGSPPIAAALPPPALDAGVLLELEKRFARPYPFLRSTRLPAKTSVSTLRRRFTPDAEDAVAPIPGLHGNSSPARKLPTFPLERTDAAEIGTAHHLFLQLLPLERASSVKELRVEAERLVCEGALRSEDAQLLDFRAIAAFWNSDLGSRIREHAASVKRELPFTFRLDAFELPPQPGQAPGGVAPEDFVVVQGIADLVVVLPNELWLVDFKTDRLAPDAEPEAKGYDRQLKLYARALAAIFRRPVTQAWLHYLSADKSVPVTLD